MEEKHHCTFYSSCIFFSSHFLWRYFWMPHIGTEKGKMKNDVKWMFYVYTHTHTHTWLLMKYKWLNLPNLFFVLFWWITFDHFLQQLIYRRKLFFDILIQVLNCMTWTSIEAPTADYSFKIVSYSKYSESISALNA